MKTIAQQLGINKFPFEIKDDNGNQIYWEKLDGYWEKSKYDDRGNQIYFEDSNGFWYKSEFDERENQIYFENSYGCWSKSEYDQNNNQTYYEDSEGRVVDNRPKELTMQEIADKFGIDVENLKIKK